MRVPLTFSYDAIFFNALVKGIGENNWYLINQHLGAPGRLEMYEFPGSDALNFAVIRLLALVVRDHNLVFNLFYLLTFPAVALTALYAFRRLHFSASTSALLGLLYAFLPYHFYHGQWHLTLSAYYMLPLMCLVVLRVGGAAGGERSNFKLSWRSLLPSLIVCLLTASTGWGYYAFLSCFFLLLAGVWSSVRRKEVRHLLSACVLIAVVIGGLLLNLAPSLIHNIRFGTPSNVAERGSADAEVYGLKVTQMLLPVTGHRLPALAAFKDAYNRHAPLVNENDFVTLGLLGSAGFLLTLVSFFDLRGVEGSGGDLLQALAALNVGAVLLATVGGFSSLFTHTLFSQIRVFNRISIFIAFFSLTAVGVCLEKIRVRAAATFPRRVAWGASLAALFALGVLDQTTPRLIPNHDLLKAEYRNDRDFVNSIEAAVPRGGMIFQLPYVEFPESTRYYELFRGYLHSENLRWSFASMKGSPPDLWAKAVAGQNAGQLIQTLALADFSGLYIDRGYYADRASGLESQLARLLGRQPLVSADHRLSFFNLAAYSAKLRRELPPEELARMREVAAHPLRIKWGDGFYALEEGGGENWRWCSGEGELQIFNGASAAQDVRLEFSVVTGHPETARFALSGPSVKEELTVSARPTFISRQFSLPPGENVIRFASDAARVDAPADPRLMVFRVMNFSLAPKRIDSLP